MSNSPITLIPKFENMNITYALPHKVDFDALDVSVGFTKISISKDSDNCDTIDYHPFRVSKIQRYNPIYSTFFELTDNNYDNIFFNHKYQIHTMDSVFDWKTKKYHKKDVFVKFSPLLDPMRYIVGKYNIGDDKMRNLPKLGSTDVDCYKKYINPMNASYTDNLFCYLSSQLLNEYKMDNCIDYYGSFVGIQEKFKLNVDDDLEYLSNSSFFRSHVGKIMFIENYNDAFANIHESMYGSHSNKKRLLISEDTNIESESYINMDDMEINSEINIVSKSDVVITAIPDDDIKFAISDIDWEIEKSLFPNADTNISQENDIILEISNECSSTDSDSNCDENDDESSIESSQSQNESMSETDDDSSHGDESSYGDEEDTHIYINDFPVQLICMEKCSGTLDELLDNDELGEKEAISAMMQVIMSLISFQKAFNMTHNDLHTNNIMFVNTPKKFIYYIVGGKKYRVPTFGKIYKIIDFGRAIYTFRGTIFCSDCFSQGGDAYGQYNCVPFINPNNPEILPNYSFDLCRLGCSIYDFLFDEDNNPDDSENIDNRVSQDMGEFKTLIEEWCTSDSGKNILYRKNGNERYPGFKMYKMISRTKHNAIPLEQLHNPIFAKFDVGMSFICNKKELNITINIDNIPECT